MDYGLTFMAPFMAPILAPSQAFSQSIMVVWFQRRKKSEVV